MNIKLNNYFGIKNFLLKKRYGFLKKSHKYNNILR